MVLSRTGRVLNIARCQPPRRRAPRCAVAEALAEVIAKQCGPAGGNCGGEAQVKVGPPPLGGDEPGFLAAGDLPPVGPVSTRGTPPRSSCRRRTSSARAARTSTGRRCRPKSRSSRVYLHPGQRDELLRGQPDRAHPQGREGGQGAGREDQDQPEECKERKLTATVSEPEKVARRRRQRHRGHRLHRHRGAEGRPGTDKFRVGIVQTGTRSLHLRQPQGRLRLHRRPVGHHRRTRRRAGHPGHG